MKRQGSYGLRFALASLVIAVALGGGHAKADFTFGQPVNLGPTVNTSGVECFATISSDGLELYLFDLDFLRPGGVGGWDIWVARRPNTSEPWGEPVNLGATINSEYDDGKPSISADGLSLYFCSNRPGGYGAFDLWVSTRATTTDDWGEPLNLGEPVNSIADEVFPCVSADGLELYFNEWGVFRPGGYGDSDIWVARRATTDDAWGEPVNLGEAVNSAYYESCPYLSPDGLLLFFHGWRTGGPGPEDIWVSTRSSTSAPWSSPAPLPVPINCRYTDGTAGISTDGSTFYFASLRGGGCGITDIWQAPIMPIVDFNGDGRADDGDVDILKSYMGTDEGRCDIGPMPWGDGIVDEADLEVLMSYWGQEVSYPYNPRQASTPMPLEQGVADVEQARFLSWWPGRDASEHDVYIGTNPAAVEAADTSDTTGVYRGRQQASEYNLTEDVLPGQTCYWRVDEVSADGVLTRGEIWSFSIVDYLFIDDMEFRGDQIWDIWLDGWGDPNNGSVVYYPETNIVHGGEQSMYLLYDNSTAAISQVSRVWEVPQDWTARGFTELSLWFRGRPASPDGIRPGNDADMLNISLVDSAGNRATIEHEDPAATQIDTFTEWSIGLADFADQGVNIASVNSLIIGVGNPAGPVLGGSGLMYFDDITIGNPPPCEAVVFDFESGAQGWGGLKDGTAPTVSTETHSGGGSQSLRVTIDETANEQQEGGWASPRDFTAAEADISSGGFRTLSFWYRIDDPDFDGRKFVFQWIMSTESWSGGGWYGNRLLGVVIADGQWHQQTADLSILGEAAGGWQGTWGDQTAWAFRDDLRYSFEIAVAPTDNTAGSNLYIDDVTFE